MNCNSSQIYTHPIYSEPEIHHLLLLAHLQGKISELQLGTAYLMLSTYKRYESPMIKEALGHKETPQVIALFNANGTITEKAREIILETINFAPDPLRYIDAERLGLWFEEMRTVPETEKHFLISKRPNQSLKKYKELDWTCDLDNHSKEWRKVIFNETKE